MHRYFKLTLWIIIYLAISFGIGQITQGSMDSWYRTLEKPAFNPPNFLFPIVWGFLYILIAAAGWRLWDVGASKTLKGSFILYTLMNWAWTPIFFGAHQLLLGFIWIILINAVTIFIIMRAWKPVRLTSLLMILPLCWTLFAMILNYAIWALNS
jgi:tryptophan-rich sensory protein